jgi:hypothetical protein
VNISAAPSQVGVVGVDVEGKDFVFGHPLVCKRSAVHTLL